MNGAILNVSVLYTTCMCFSADAPGCILQAYLRHRVTMYVIDVFHFQHLAVSRNANHYL